MGSLPQAPPAQEPGPQQDKGLSPPADTPHLPLDTAKPALSCSQMCSSSRCALSCAQMGPELLMLQNLPWAAPDVPQCQMCPSGRASSRAMVQPPTLAPTWLLSPRPCRASRCQPLVTP